MHILVTNDDGVDAPGLLALQQALQKVGKVTVFAPDHNWSAAGHTKTMHKPLRVNQVKLADGTMAYASSGAPSDCVALAVLGLSPRRPDLVVSGINQGANLGHDITYSGTVAAAMEGVIFGIPSVAASLLWSPEPDFRAAAEGLDIDELLERLVRHASMRTMPRVSRWTRRLLKPLKAR